MILWCCGGFVAVGDTLAIVGPATADAALADIDVTLDGAR